ncbi:MAG: exodeoxyribonuclease VII large subunit, partial [Bacteroidota bacterium]
FKARVEFSERYGLKLTIEEFDPDYTLGKLEMKRRETLRRLQQLGLLEKNKSLRLPPVLQRIAVLTSEQAAGCQDFLKQLGGNPFGYRFRLQMFPVSVQGTFVEPEMLAQLANLARQPEQFDAAVVIRGGGAKLDLAAFDSFELCRAAACLPLPLVTGIGHDVDETVLDCVAHTALKTPTAVADFILHRNLQFETEAGNLALAVKTWSETKRRDAALRLQHFSQVLDFQTKNLLQRQAMMLDYVEKEIPAALKNSFAKNHLQLDILEKTASLLSPEAALRRGFSITFKNGKALTAASQALPGDEIETIFREGKLRSVVKSNEVQVVSE